MRFCLLAAFASAACIGVSCAHAEAPAKAPPIYQIVERIPGADGGWDFASIDTAGNRLLVARSDAIEAVDLATRAVTGKLAEAHRGHQVFALDNGATIFETDGETGLARFVAARDGTVLGEVVTGKKPDAAFLDPATGLIAVMNAGDGSIALVDPHSRSLAGRIAIGGGLEFGVADGKGGAFVNIEDQNVIARVDLAGRKRVGTIPLPGCDGPTGLALVGGGARLISACANGVALVVDAKSGKMLQTLPIGSDPDAVLVDEARGLAFIPCGGTGTLIEISIADPRAFAVVGVIPTQTGAKTGALDPRDGRIYLPAATLAPREPGAKRGKPVAGTFTVLVVAPVAKKDRKLQFVDPALFNPEQILPAPAVAGSLEEARELAYVRSIVTSASPKRIEQAKWDADHETPEIFDAVIGRKLEELPNSWALLRLVQTESDLAVNGPKAFFNRTRPYGVDPALPNCEAATGKKPTRSYPSGHASLGYSVGWTLGQLLPGKAPAILSRAADYAMSREVCGVHFASDTEASHVIGTLVAARLFADPRLAGLIAAARSELSAN